MLNNKKLLTKVLASLKTLLSDLTLHTFTISNPLYTNGAGGYYQRGNVVYVNARVYVNGTFPANDYNTVTNNGSFPTPALQAALSVCFNSADSASGALAVINDNGSLVVQSGGKALTSSTIYITGAYVALGGGN